MQCLILAGGLGTRIKSIAGDTPKALLPVGCQTFIDWQLQWLKSLGVTNAVMALGHGGDVIERHLKKIIEERGQSPFPTLQFSYDGETLVGTGGAIRKAKPFLEENFLVTYGDSFLFLDLNDFAEVFQTSGKPLLLSIFKNEDEGDKSNVFYEAGHPLIYDKINPTPAMKYIDYGISFINRDYFFQHTPEARFDFAQFLTETCGAKKAAPYVAKHMFHEIGSPGGYHRFVKLLTEVDFNLTNLKKKFGL